METTAQKLLWGETGESDVLQDGRSIIRVRFNLRVFQAIHYENGQEVPGLKDASATMEPIDGQPIERLLGEERLFLRLGGGSLWPFLFDGECAVGAGEI